MKPNRFDVHAHYTPPGTIPRAAPGLNFVSSPMPAWSPEFALDFMDRHDIATQLLSLPTPLAKQEARRINEYGATLVQQRPARFGLLASLPMDDVEAALSEIAFAFDQLDADGVVMVINYGGNYLGNVRFEPVFAELNKRSATVFLHPTIPAGYECVACGRPGPVIEIYFRHLPHGERHALCRSAEPVPQRQVHPESCGRALADVGAADRHNWNVRLGSSFS